MATKILIKSNKLSGNKPPIPQELSYGELAINVIDGALYTKKLNNEIVNLISWDQLDNKPLSFTPSIHSHGNISTDGKITINRFIEDTHKIVVTDNDGNLYRMDRISPERIRGVIRAEGTVSSDIQEMSISIYNLEQQSSNLVLNTDPRLSDDRTPLAHTHPISDIEGSIVTNDDPRLTDSRIPLFHSHTTNNNTFIGTDSLISISTGIDNTSIGVDALRFNTTGSNNTGIGKGVMANNISGSNNTAAGLFALLSNSTAVNNTALGIASLMFNTTGNDNSAIGAASLYNNTTGINNVAIGNYTGINNTTGSYNVMLGFSAGTNTSSLNNCIILGTNARAMINGDLVIGSSSNPVNTSLSVGVAGAAGTLPARPIGYLSLRLNGVLVKIPYYRE